MAYRSFRPGRVWLDTEGKRIQAHGGSVLYLDKTYYWYGENKEKTDGISDIWHWGCGSIPRRICTIGRMRG